MKALNLTRFGNLVLPAGILTIILLMIVPTPAFMLDIFFVLNIAISVAILMAAMNAEKPLDFSSFPTVLLFATLLRLALNVASTRVVLVHGHEGGAAAGHVIEAFGAFLVGGNFIVGLFVFLILMIINMIVVTKGAGRVSEVSARFTLDALPGKQMAIDADLAAGLLTPDEAKARRREVSTEADFYGSMDGASKFVKGDAIAAIIILTINIVAGFCLGIFSHDLTAGESAEVYITLAVGDAMVAQVPALLLSIAAAIIVTRVSDSRDLSGQISGQFSNPQIWLPVAVILTVIGLIPAMPQTFFLPAGAIAFLIFRHLKAAKKLADLPVIPIVEERDPGKIFLEDVSDHSLVSIELGYGLVHLASEKNGSPLITRLTGVRRQLSQGFGFVVPQFRIRDTLDLDPNHYRILLGGVAIGAFEIPGNRILAIDAGEANPAHQLRGSETHDPSFGCAALWIEPSSRDFAIAEGFLTVDASTVIATHLNQLLVARGAALLGPDQVRELLESVKETAPGLIESIHPQPLALAALTRLFRDLVNDGLSIAHPLPILSSLSAAVLQTLEHDRLIDLVRSDLGALITGRICGPAERLPVITLDAELEGAIVRGMHDPATGQPMIEPDLARSISDEMGLLLSSRPNPDVAVALIVQPRARRAMAMLLKQRVPACHVVSISELPADQPIEVFAIIGGKASETRALAAPDLIQENEREMA